VLQSSDCDSHRRHEIQQALGHHSNLLVNAISNLSPFLDENGYHEATTVRTFQQHNECFCPYGVQGGVPALLTCHDM
jgi:hypothetical protein